MTYLQHHGIEGQKWGVRNGPPYPLRPSDYSKAELKNVRKYQKEMIKYQKDSARNRERLTVDAYNKTANEYNAGKIDEFNRTHDPNDKNYEDDYYKQFDRDNQLNYDQMMISELEENVHYRKAQELAEKYSYIKLSELYVKNNEFVKDLKNANKKGKTSWDLDMSKYALDKKSKW